MDDAAFQEAMRQAMSLIRAEKFAEAEAIFRAAGEERASDGTLAMNLAATLAQQGKLEESLPWHDRAAALRPDDPAAHFNRGRTLLTLKRYALAAESFQRTLQLVPNSIEVVHELAVCNQMLGRDGIAAQQFALVLQAMPDHPFAHAYMSQAIRELGQFEEALAHIARAVELEANNPQFRHCYGLNLLLHGQWEAGWIYNESRWRTEDFGPSIQSLADRPVWDGSPLGGKTIYIHPEQGLGDAIQFIRYVPLVAKRGGRVVAGCNPAARELIAGVEGVADASDMFGVLPPHDCWIPLLSLPRIFNSRVDSVPADVPYLHVDPQRTRRWAQRIGSDGSLRVGLAWAGNPDHMRDTYRSTTLKQLAPLAGVGGVKFFALQKGAGAEQSKSPPPGMHFTDLNDELHDLADTAAAMTQLDLVISVDTSVAHLAGALGKPVWLLLGYSPDWRWLLNRTDTPWYPTMKILRQRKLHDWPELIRRTAGELARLVKKNL